MKKFTALLLVCAAFAMPSIAQSYNGKLTGPTADTLTNAQTVDYVLKVTGAKSNLTFQYNVTKVSGTVGGTIKVFGSIDGGVKYVDTPLNTYTIANGNQVGGFTLPTNPYGTYKVTVTTPASQVSVYEIWGLYRQ